MFLIQYFLRRHHYNLKIRNIKISIYRINNNVLNIITGCSNGLGKELCSYKKKKGENVIGFSRNLEKDNNVIFSVRESAKGEEVIRDFKSHNVKYVVLEVPASLVEYECFIVFLSF